MGLGWSSYTTILLFFFSFHLLFLFLILRLFSFAKKKSFARPTSTPWRRSTYAGEDGSGGAAVGPSNSSSASGTPSKRRPTGSSAGGGSSGQNQVRQVEIFRIAEPCPLIDPSQVVITKGEILVADPVLTPIGKRKTTCMPLFPFPF